MVQPKGSSRSFGLRRSRRPCLLAETPSAAPTRAHSRGRPAARPPSRPASAASLTSPPASPDRPFLLASPPRSWLVVSGGACGWGGRWEPRPSVRTCRSREKSPDLLRRRSVYFSHPDKTPRGSKLLTKNPTPWMRLSRLWNLLH